MAILKTPLLSLAFASIAAALLGGCSSESGMFRTPGGPAMDLHVWVRDASSHRPIEGATVVADTIARDHPFSAATVLSQTGPESSRARTDAQGAAFVEVLDDREYRIVVWAAGHPPVVFGPFSLRRGAGEWIDPELTSSSAPSPLQVRIGSQSGETKR